MDQPHGFPFKLIRETPLFVPTSFRREPERLPWQLEVSPRFFIFCTIETVSNVGR